MTQATGARSKIGYIVESTFGTTPATPNLAELPVLEFGLQLTRDEYADNAIRSDRMERTSLSGNKTVAGTINVNFAHSLYDVLLESLMQSTFTTNVLKTGVTRKSISFERGHQDIAQYAVYSGVIVDKFQITVPAAGLVTAQFDLIGKDQTAWTSTSIDTDGYTAAAVKPPFTDNGTNGWIKEGGSAIGVVTNIQITVDNKHDKNFTVGTAVVRDFTTHNAEVTFTATIVVEDMTLFGKFLAGTATSIDIKLDDGTNTVQVQIPNVKLTGYTSSINGMGVVTAQITGKGLFDATSGSNIVFTRT